MRRRPYRSERNPNGTLRNRRANANDEKTSPAVTTESEKSSAICGRTGATAPCPRYTEAVTNATYLSGPARDGVGSPIGLPAWRAGCSARLSLDVFESRVLVRCALQRYADSIRQSAIHPDPWVSSSNPSDRERSG